MKTKIGTHSDAVEYAAECMRELVRSKAAAVIGLTVNKDCCEIYDPAFRNEGRKLFSDCSFFLLNELVPEDGKSSVSLAEWFGERYGLADGNVFAIPTSEPETFDAMIKAADGFDLVVAGIGSNSSLVYNEPSTPFDSLTHKQKLTKYTRNDISEFLGISEADVPEYGLTAGIRTLTRDRSIIVPAFGTKISEAVFKMLYARTDSVVPSAFLQLPSKVEVILDNEAARQL